MSFRPRMTSVIQGMRARQPLQWRAFDGLVADLWHAEGSAGGNGYYLSPDPRIIVLLDETGGSFRLSGSPDSRDAGWADGRVIFVPAGMPLWSRIPHDCHFSHLDLHFDGRALERRLRQGAGAGGLSDAVHRLAIHKQSAEIETLARLLASEVASPARHDLFAEGLVQAILGGLLAGPQDIGHSGGLTPLQMRRLREHLGQHLGRRVPTAELAEVAGLSESWFAHSFKQMTGETPLQWQSRLRIEAAQEALRDQRLALAEVASLTGFADQAHMTRVFRSYTGTTPGAWRRSHASV